MNRRGGAFSADSSPIGSWDGTELVAKLNDIIRIVFPVKNGRWAKECGYLIKVCEDGTRLASESEGQFRKFVRTNRQEVWRIVDTLTDTQVLEGTALETVARRVLCVSEPETAPVVNTPAIDLDALDRESPVQPAAGVDQAVLL